MSYLGPNDTPPKKGKGSKLSPMMEKFIEHLLVDPQRNASNAVLAAGYKTTNPAVIGAKLLRHPLVKAKIELEDNKRRERMEFSADFLLSKLMRIIEDTEETNPQAALRAIELAGKSIALWKDRQEISGPDGAAIEMEQKVRENVADFTSKLARLSAAGGTSNVVKFPDGSGEG